MLARDERWLVVRVEALASRAHRSCAPGDGTRAALPWDMRLVAVLLVVLVVAPNASSAGIWKARRSVAAAPRSAPRGRVAPRSFMRRVIRGGAVAMLSLALLASPAAATEATPSAVPADGPFTRAGRGVDSFVGSLAADVDA